MREQKKMLATLKTRCGCTKQIEIPFPPNRNIILPILPSLTFSPKDEDLLNQWPRYREFELQTYGGGPNGYADYLERWQD